MAMKNRKQTKREARHLFRLCLVNNSLDENNVRQVVENILKSKRRGNLALATEFERLVRLDRLRHEAQVESATPLPSYLRSNLQASLLRTYGPELSMSFEENPSLIGGVRVRVGSDVYDGSVKAGLAALEKRFETNGASK
jgi:F-type H+-transporting ATPase subunit delta